MSPFAQRMLFVFIFIFILNSFLNYYRRKTSKNNVEMPSKVQRIGISIQVVMTALMVFCVILGLLLSQTEMTIVFFVISVIFVFILFGMRRKFKKFYSESSHSFELGDEYRTFNVKYEDIIDWKLSKKQIGVLDKTKEDKQYIFVNLAFSEPEIFLRKMTEMTFAGKFRQSEDVQTEDPNRKQEWVNFLEKNGYGHLLEEYAKE